MKKRTKVTKIIIRIAIAVLMVLMVVGIVFVILDENTNIGGSIYEIIAFVIGIVGMLMAIFSEVDADKQEKKNNEMAREIRELVEAEVNDTKLLKKILAKLDEPDNKKK